MLGSTAEPLKEGLLEELTCELSFEGRARINLVQGKAPGIGQSIPMVLGPAREAENA